MEYQGYRVSYVAVTLIGFGCYSLLGKHTKAQNLLFSRFFKLGGVYVKFLQMLAVREESVDLNIAGIDNALAVFDKVSYELLNITALLKSELGTNAELLQLRSIEPFAAGSFAQVYRATLQGGQEVVVKVLRPSATKHLLRDMSSLGFAARIASVMMPKGMLDIMPVFKDFKRITTQEIDYVQETKAAARLYEQFKSSKTIYIPKTYVELSTKHIIVQDFVDGLPLTELLSDKIHDKVAYVQQNLGTDLNYVMENLAYELLSGSLKPGGTHGDPHPGNIYILPNNRLALIDFGISSTMTKHQPEFRRLLVEYVKLYRGNLDIGGLSQAMVGYFVPQLTQSIKTLSTFYGDQDLVKSMLEEISKSVTNTVSEQADDPAMIQLLSQHRMLVIFTKVINKNNRFGFKVTIEAPAFLRSSQLFLNIIQRVGCNKQLLASAYERVLAEYDNIQVAEGPSYDNASIDLSMHVIANWLERLHYSDPIFYSRIIRSWGVGK